MLCYFHMDQGDGLHSIWPGNGLGKYSTLLKDHSKYLTLSVPFTFHAHIHTAILYIAI